MNGAIEGAEMEKRQCRRDEKYKGKKGTRKCRWRILRRAFFSRFGNRNPI